MLIDSIQKEPLGFNVIPFNNPAIQYTILVSIKTFVNQMHHIIKSVKFNKILFLTSHKIERGVCEV